MDEVSGRIARAAARAGRDPRSVVLVAVAKTVAAAALREAVACGLTDLGENRVQEAETHVGALGRTAARWHMIGHLQRNKASRAAELFDLIHGVDSAALAEVLSRRAAAAGRRLPVLIEVNVSGEASKFGVAPDSLDPLLENVAGLPGLALDGLMTVGAPVGRAEDARSGFARLRTLRDRAEKTLGRPLPELSMGMSGDFEVAVEEGATLVRIGTALFGGRNVQGGTTCS
ncbi:MAG: YggS family pyridoxal phosphate-dependent enzyme [Candidatus Eisenbacteria bacterium]|uniref:Pyridoxal phosphate homeostasis protein n=1 Tax=Eiseniibacteriota bacterium TaxID=2212470 RepID=A0A9D6L7I0_UNCEI|nr:YggS family pyridoxal phosphate-dependent enzyme [Candidatus Eisenbacteria bacterium]MBI3539025.1 YggS family pyridoxal phosphate-dependent enzyme [Candidatus Eisenbacteria bacterium]